MEEARAGPSDQSPPGRWLEHGSAPCLDGAKYRAIQAAVAPWWEGAGRISGEFELV